MKEYEKEQISRQKHSKLALVNANAAGIDLGDTIHAVAVPPDRDETSVRTFGTMTCDLQTIAACLQECNVDTVAMESTGVYWKPLFNLLIQSGFEVYLVNAKQVRNVSGRKNNEDEFKNYLVADCSRAVTCPIASRKPCVRWCGTAEL